MERRTQQERRFYRWRGESSPTCVVCVCGMRAVGLADYRWALPCISISVAIAMQPVHRLQIRQTLHN